MAEQNKGTEVQLANMKIPYYSPRFECLRDMLVRYKDISGKQTVQWQAQWNAVIGGIQYYYAIIQEEEEIQRKQNAGNRKDTDVLKKLCDALVESMNRAIYCLIDTRYIALSDSENDGSQKSEDINKKLCPYREYLQWICNNFMRGKQDRRLIIKVSLDLLKNRVSMDTLFPEAHDYETEKKAPSLCVVFYPSHDELISFGSDLHTYDSVPVSDGFRKRESYDTWQSRGYACIGNEEYIAGMF